MDNLTIATLRKQRLTPRAFTKDKAMLMTDFERIKYEFPTYPVETLPPIPAQWNDLSWHHDPCPSFGIDGLIVYCDFPNIEDRFDEQPTRFFVAEGPEELCTNHWHEVIAFVEKYELKF